MDVPQHDNTQADTDTPQGADDWTLDDVTGQEVREDGTVVFHLKDGGDKELKTPTRVTNQPGSETVRAALALAKAQNRPADEVMAEIFARRNQAPATPAQNQPDPEPEANPLDAIDAEITSKAEALEAAQMDADAKQVAALTRELAKLEAKRAQVELRQEYAAERKQSNQEAQAEAALNRQFEQFEAKAFKLIPELRDPESQEFQEWQALWESYGDTNNPALAYTAALELAQSRQAQAPQSASVLRNPQRPQFTPPGSAPRGRTVQVDPSKLIADPMTALRMLNDTRGGFD